jgi:predicted Zn-dependent protease
MTVGVRLATVAVCAALAGCVMAPGDQKPVTSNAAAPAGPAAVVTGGAKLKADEVGWETSADPYAYHDIRPGTRPVQKSDEAGLWMVMDGMERKLRTAGNRITDPALNEYVSGIVCKLAGPYCPDIRTYVVRAPHFNATMMGNGTMQVWSGLLLRCRNEAQLATVLGHEIGHYIRRHSIQGMHDRVAKADFLIFLQIGLAASGLPPGINNIAELVAMGGHYAFGRDHEREADLIGITLLAQYGYDAREAPLIWAQLQQEMKANENYSAGSLFYASHPPQEEREATLMRLAEKLQPEADKFSKYRDQYLAAVGPWRASFLADELRLGKFKTSRELLKMLFADGFNTSEILFFQGELYRLRGKTPKSESEKDTDLLSFLSAKKDVPDRNDFEVALEYYEKALKKPNPAPVIYRSIGLAQQRLGDDDAAREAFKTYLSLAGNPKDRRIIEFMIKQTS